MASPALANYYPYPPAPTPGGYGLGGVCYSRMDPNCMVKEGNYANYTAYQYQMPNYSYWDNRDNYYPYEYDQSYNYGYNNYQYQYQYQYCYGNGCNQYSYNQPSYYGYNNNPYDSSYYYGY